MYFVNNISQNDDAHIPRFCVDKEQQYSYFEVDLVIKIKDFTVRCRKILNTYYEGLDNSSKSCSWRTLDCLSLIGTAFIVRLFHVTAFTFSIMITFLQLIMSSKSSEGIATVECLLLQCMYSHPAEHHWFVFMQHTFFIQPHVFMQPHFFVL